MRIIKKLGTVGNSTGIILDKPILDKLKIKKGDYIEIEVKKV